MANEVASSKPMHHMIRHDGKQWPAIPYQPPMEVPLESELRKPTPYHNLCVYIPVINQSLWVLQGDLAGFDSGEFDKIDKTSEPKRHDAFMAIIEHLADDEEPNYAYLASEILQHQLAEQADESDQEESDQVKSDKFGIPDEVLSTIPLKTSSYKSVDSGDKFTPFAPNSHHSAEVDKVITGHHIQSLPDRTKPTKAGGQNDSLRKLNQVATEKLEQKKGKRKQKAFIPDEDDEDLEPKTKKPKKASAKSAKPKKAPPAPTPYFAVSDDDEYNVIVKEEPKNDSA
ncbi:uncharacterized protein BKA78DRAFT_341795 [Phyllosticta capitalensis]|uniref:Uncharacterized protein n=1 Tax=Phyllosticta capitalensis TaxID=121624 RepID=A0ABR1YTV3_9PEZI